MHIDKVTYQKIFPISQFVNQKIGVEVVVNEGEDSMVALAYAKDTVEEFHSKIVELQEKLPEIQSKYEQQEDADFENVKFELRQFNNMEDAQAYLDTTAYKYTIEAKKIVSSLQPK